MKPAAAKVPAVKNLHAEGINWRNVKIFIYLFGMKCLKSTKTETSRARTKTEKIIRILLSEDEVI
jgi:hypothetical protein